MPEDPESEGAYAELVATLAGINGAATPAPAKPKPDIGKMFTPAWHIATAVKFLSPKALAAEPGLIATKWLAYYELSPHRANIEFAKAFSAAFRAHYRRTVDLHEAETVKGINLAEIRNPKVRTGQKGKGSSHLTSINTARQIADRFGLPYPLFITFCMKFATTRGVRTITRPNQLVPTNSNSGTHGKRS